MRTLFRWILILTLGLLLLGILGGAALLHALTSGPDISISINGEALDLVELGWLPAGATLLGLMVAGLVVCVVLPLTLLLGIGLPLLLVAGAFGLVLALLLGVGAMLSSPLIIFILVMALLLRPRRTSGR
jgi:hypothetical protein